MELFYAESKSSPGFGIVKARAGHKYFLTHSDRGLWENAALEDWMYLDETVNGELLENFKLVPCNRGVKLTNDEITVIH